MWLPLRLVGTSSDGFGERETAPLPRHLRVFDPNYDLTSFGLQSLPETLADGFTRICCHWTILSSPVSLGGAARPLGGAGGCDAVWVAVE